MKRIIVIQTAATGDVVLSTALLESLHTAYPDAILDVLVKKGNESLFNNHPYIRWVYAWDKKKHKYRNLLSLLFAIRQNNYDLVVNLQRFASSGFLTAFSGAEHRCGFNKNPFALFFSHRAGHTIHQGGLHEVERNFKLINHFDGPQKSNPRLYPSKQDFARVSSLKTIGFICVAPASLWYTKQFPAQKWSEFIASIPEDYVVYLLGSSQDVALCDNVERMSLRNNIMNLSGKLSLLEVAALMRDAKMNYVNDSAPMHIASSVNAPVTAVFCSTIPDFGFGPLSEKSYIVENRKKLLCRPCGIHGRISCPEKHFECAIGISSSQLLNTLDENGKEL